MSTQEAMPNYKSKLIYTETPRSISGHPYVDPSEGERVGYYAQSSGSEGGTRENLEWVLDVLYRRKWLIFMTFLLIFGALLYRTFNQTLLYEARSFVMVDMSRQPISDKPVAATGAPAVRIERNIMSEIFVLKNSGMIEERVGRQLTRMEKEGALKGHIPSGSVQYSVPQRDVNNVIEVAVTSSRPADAALLANLYAQEYVAHTQETSRSYLSASRELLANQENQHLSALRQAEEQIQSYQQAAGAVALSRDGTTIVSQIASLEAQRDQTRLDLQARRAKLQSIEQELNTVSPQLARRIGSDLEARLKTAQERLAKLQSNKEQLLLRNPRLTENSPEVAEYNQQIASNQTLIASLSRQLVDEVSAAGGAQDGNSGLSYVTDLKRESANERIEISSLEAKLQQVEQRLASYQAELTRIPAREVNMARLERARQYSEQMYQHVAGRLQETQVSEQAEPGYAKLISRAAEPRMPKNASGTSDLILNLLMALSAGIAVAFVRDKVDSRLYKPHQLRNHGYEVISVIPNLRPIVQKEYSGKRYIEQDGKKFSTSFVALLNPMSSAAEAVRSLRTTIQFSRPDAVLQTVLVSSPAMEEGKSTTAANLAIVMAQAGRKTLLIDADLRRPNLHNLFGESMGPGLVQLLFDRAEFQEEAYRTHIDDLYLVKAGGSIVPPGKASNGKTSPEHGMDILNPSELLGSKRMRDLLDLFRLSFDVIIIDTPPVLVATDATLLSTQCDGTLLVTRAGKTKEGDLEESTRMLAEVGAEVIGVVFNGFDLSHAYGHTYRYKQYSKATQYGTYYYGNGNQRSWKKYISKTHA